MVLGLATFSSPEPVKAKLQASLYYARQERRAKADALAFVDLPILGDPFPATLQRNPRTYRVLDFTDQYSELFTGNTHYVDASGAGDFTGLEEAINAASSLDIISIAPGEYAFPASTVTKSLKFVAPNRGVYFGAFESIDPGTMLSTIDYSGTELTNINIGKGSVTIKGLLRKNIAPGQYVSGSAFCATNNECLDYENLGVLSVFSGSTSSNVSLGTGGSEALGDLFESNSALAWTSANSGALLVSGASVVVMLENIVMASYANYVLQNFSATSTVVTKYCEIYGGKLSTLLFNDGGLSISYGSKFSGSGTSDLLSYKMNTIAVEANIVAAWPASGSASNASTGHDTCKVLRCGSRYAGGSRTVHDVQNGQSYVFSCHIGEALFGDGSCLAVGLPYGTSDTVNLLYGDVKYFGTRVSDFVLNSGSGATATAIELTDPWVGV